MNVTKVVKSEFAVIGKEGSTKDGIGFVQNLWAEANAHFEEIASLAKQDESGRYIGFWGAMSDFSRSFQPWENQFSEGLYLAGAEVEVNAEVPEGWTKWVMPASEYLVVKDEGGNTFIDMISYMREHEIELAGAAYDFSDPKENGQQYIYFPIRRLQHT